MVTPEAPKDGHVVKPQPALALPLSGPPKTDTPLNPAATEKADSRAGASLVPHDPNRPSFWDQSSPSTIAEENPLVDASGLADPIEGHEGYGTQNDEPKDGGQAALTTAASNEAVTVPTQDSAGHELVSSLYESKFSDQAIGAAIDHGFQLQAQTSSPVGTLSLSIDPSGKIVHDFKAASDAPTTALAIDQVSQDSFPSIGKSNAIDSAKDYIRPIAVASEQLPTQVFASIEPSGRIVYYSDELRDQSIASIISALPGLSPSIDSANSRIIFFTTDASGESRRVSTMALSQGLSPSITSFESGHGIILLSSLEGTKAGGVTPFSMALPKPNVTPSFVPPRTGIAFFGQDSDGDNKIVSTQDIAVGQAVSLGPTGDIIFYSTTTGLDAQTTSIVVSISHVSDQSISLVTSPAQLVYYSAVTEAAMHSLSDTIPVSTRLASINPGSQVSSGEDNTPTNATGTSQGPLPFVRGSGASSIKKYAFDCFLASFVMAATAACLLRT